MPVITEVGARCGKSARRVLSGGRPDEGRPYRNGAVRAEAPPCSDYNFSDGGFRQ